MSIRHRRRCRCALVAAFAFSVPPASAQFDAAHQAPVVSGLTFWLDAQQEVTLNGALVESWGNSSGVAAVTTAGSRRPTLVGNGLNTYPVVRFDGVDDQLTRTGVLELPTGTSVQTPAFVVSSYGSVSSSTGWGAGFAWGTGSTARKFDIGTLGSEFGGGLGVHTYSGYHSSNTVPVANQPYLQTMDYSGGTIRYWVDGVTSSA